MPWEEESGKIDEEAGEIVVLKRETFRRNTSLQGKGMILISNVANSARKELRVPKLRPEIIFKNVANARAGKTREFAVDERLCDNDERNDWDRKRHRSAIRFVVFVLGSEASGRDR